MSINPTVILEESGVNVYGQQVVEEDDESND